MRVLDERFDMLRELANIYIVKPENLGSILREGLLGTVEMKQMIPFVQLRADYKKINNDLREK